MTTKKRIETIAKLAVCAIFFILNFIFFDFVLKTAGRGCH